MKTVAVGTFTYRSDRGSRFFRRSIDLAIAGTLLLAAAPVVALAALAILLEDGRPVFFLQRRVGRYERLFTIVKLRTMRVSMCADGVSPTSSADARITRVGRVLRKLSIDELPQLINVLRGEMTLVGPRPEMPFIVSRYEPWQHLRHLATPGITCIWQVRHRSTIPLDRPEATILDLDYIRRASPMLDSSLLARTILAVLLPKGAY